MSAPSLAPRSPGDLRVLAAACDMAVLRALELVGKRVAGQGTSRSRMGTLRRSGKDWSEAHTVWRPEQRQVDAALSGAWSVLPRLTAEHGCCALVEPDLARLLDRYVRRLVASGQAHSFDDLVRVLEDAAAAG